MTRSNRDCNATRLQALTDDSLAEEDECAALLGRHLARLQNHSLPECIIPGCDAGYVSREADSPSSPGCCWSRAGSSRSPPGSPSPKDRHPS